ncbi:hypothetical protein ADIARSV_2589 [Arcticibacter svalbardensis MN12-7]|uniref:Uncharacterized protein n=1 Tax=Arcticibacter svalbardensis MN12-7 TaxID=1150600 RepID=R9GRC4_9SPHI|nr:hypothetical protein [Arcticibacter svalbardensis]EOR94238.1 hypothetical protein ADIARSV_2589 [Arcticibacter svalbardensis MN12-7]
MKFLGTYFIQVTLLCILLSCKKTSPVESIEPEPISSQIAKDSISFSINGINYSFNNTNLIGIGNSQINIKAFNDAIPGRDYAYKTAGKLWYGNPDSTMYSSIFGMRSSINQEAILKIYFNKKYKTTELVESIQQMIPKNQSDIFKPGIQSFAIDFEKENTREGVVLSLYTQGISLSSTKPGFSIYLQSHKMDIQDNSSFEFLKVEHIKDDKYLLEAVFSMNLFDQDEKLYRVEKGFMRKNINMAHNMASF